MKKFKAQIISWFQNPKHRWKVVLAGFMVFLLCGELLLSVGQFIRYKEKIRAYQVTPVLRPLVRLFVSEEFYPRTHVVRKYAWDYKTDRLQPGKEQYNIRKTFPYSVNSFGLRGKEFAIPKPDDVYRIVAFGASQTFGSGLLDHETYPFALEEALNQNVKPGMIGDKKVEVLNFGMPSKTLYYIAKHYFDDVDEMDPDMIIINNIAMTVRYDRNYKVTDYANVKFPTKLKIFEVNRFLTDNVLAYRLVRKSEQKRKIARLTRDKTLTKQYVEEVFFGTLERMYKDAHRRGIDMVVIQEPTFENPKQQIIHKNLSLERLTEIERQSNHKILLYSLMYRHIERLAQKYPDIVIVDPVEEFLHLQEQDEDNPVFFDGTHLTAFGSKVLAQRIVDELARR